MTEQQELITKDYIKELKIQNYTTKNPVFSLRIFFKYINDNDIDFTRIKIQEAQNFQGHLMTLANEEEKMKYAKSTVTVIIGCVTSYYVYLKKKKICYANPFLQIRKVKRDKDLPKNIFNEEKMNNFLKHLRSFKEAKTLIEKKQLYKAHVVAELMYSTGMRISEVIELRKEDIDFDRGIIGITDVKEKKEREGILNEYALKVLKIYVERMRDRVIFGKNNADVRLLFGVRANLKMWLNMILNRESKKLGYGHFSSHNFRHAVGCHLLKNGCDMRYIQEILGHKELRTTQVYTKVEKEDLKNVLDKYHPRVFKESRK